MPVIRDNAEPLAIVFEDDGLVPNNILPFLVYQSAVNLDRDRPEETVEALFARNGWGGMWRNGVARGHARVRFGGDHGKELEISAGEVAILPAGTGHQLVSAAQDFCVIGAYPPGSKMEITRPTPENHAKALKTIPAVKQPESDPVHGMDGPLLRLWRK